MKGKEREQKGKFREREKKGKGKALRHSQPKDRGSRKALKLESSKGNSKADFKSLDKPGEEEKERGE